MGTMVKGKPMGMYAIAMLSPVLAEDGQMVPFTRDSADDGPGASLVRSFLEADSDDGDDAAPTVDPPREPGRRAGVPPSPPSGSKPTAGRSPRRQPAKAVPAAPAAAAVSPSWGSVTADDEETIVHNEDIALVIASYLPIADFCTMLRVSSGVRAVWNAQGMWKVMYVLRGGEVAQKSRFADFRGRCKLLLSTPSTAPQRDAATPDSLRPSSRPLSRVTSTGTTSPSREDPDALASPTAGKPPQHGTELSTDELLRNLDALDANTGKLEDWVRKEARETVDAKVRRKASGGTAPSRAATMDVAKRKELYRKELKASCDATPLQRMCGHDALELIQTLDPACHEVTCTTCGVKSVMKIRAGAAVICGVEIGPIRRAASSGSVMKGGPKPKRPLHELSANPPKPHTATTVPPNSHLPPLAKKKQMGGALGTLFANRRPS